ncbi:MAG: phosphatidylserine/phosphatidylglycerophosphate/cardiolipin synthase family protein [Firmicutes bacterium]|nr:phosphatidylserine/phosphatidylglycerophosphate/cardiolipin synthase family protein [Bacillota bacterium]
MLALSLSGCGAQFGSLQAQFPAAVTESGDTLLWGAEIKPMVLSMIGRSRIFCHLTMYELGDTDVLDALWRAQQRGVAVAVVLDAKEPHTQTIAVPFLKRHGIPYRLLSIPGGISHIKSLVTDDATGLHALVGGMNFGEYSWTNHDASIYISHANPSFEGLFDADYERAGGTTGPMPPAELPLVYDAGIEPALLSAIAQARQTVDVEAFAFTSRDLISALSAAAARGVDVTVILDPREPYNRKTARSLVAGGVHVAYYAPYADEYLHAKIVSVDAGATVFVGSANFSWHGFTVNHEGDIELTDVPAFGATIDADVDAQFARGQQVTDAEAAY